MQNAQTDVSGRQHTTSPERHPKGAEVEAKKKNGGLCKGVAGMAGVLRRLVSVIPAHCFKVSICSCSCPASSGLRGSPGFSAAPGSHTRLKKHVALSLS